MSRIFLVIFIALLLASCQQKNVDTPDFNVTPSSLILKVGDTVNFNFSGNPNFITFYSGELGYRYQYRGRTSAAGKPVLKFNSALNVGGQPNSLHIMVSTDFTGVVLGDTVSTAANIVAASWTDITNRAVLATSTTAVNSGAIDLSDFAAGGKPVYIAFKYVGLSGSIQNQWTITALTVTNTLPDASVYTIANLVANSSPITTNYAGVNTFSPGWVAFPVSNTFNWVVTAGSSLVIAGASNAALATNNTEAWAIMGLLDLQKVTPDIGIAVKSINAVVDSYFYNYTSAGTYDATFVATNENGLEYKQTVRPMTITVN